jgi:hypothetical protein
MASRLDLQTLLEGIVDNVYFQPPSSINLSYPCIVYKRSFIKTRFADNAPYSLKNEYSLTVMDRNPDTLIPETLALLPSCSFDRHFMADNLNHYVFTIYY